MADELTGRLGVRILTTVEPVGPVPRPVRDALVRTAREAVSLAARQGCPDHVDVALCEREGVRLLVRGAGCAGPPGSPQDPALDAARARVEALGGRLLVRAHPGAGTEVEVSWCPAS